ncbi:DNA repair protein RecO [Rheinheimera salexigens]|uniref:DNA repair protein RecO n=1 Tax=Rheinheimera salexigens TaxID=1628148 RepID=A0A1E7Q4M6_9GAMM|nr:DNA repair protein RecO [Rheinheimera salexigens]OEY69125.1 DNA repair protein RecO [Rheinheimera salexigens]
MQNPLIAGYILHRRALGEDKLILQLLMPEIGRISAVVRKRSGKQRVALQPFQAYSLQLTGRSELKTIAKIEELAPAFNLQGKVLFSAMYINELICRIWPNDLATDQLFGLYQQSLQQLAEVTDAVVDLEPCLRQFEFELLIELGIAIDWTCDHSGQTIIAQQHYQWLAEQGFVPAKTGWLGQHLVNIGNQYWADSDTRRSAKQLSRVLLAPLLGAKPLASKALFN